MTHLFCRSAILLWEHATPKNPSLQTQMKVSTLTSTQEAPLSQGELSQAVQGAVNKYIFKYIYLKTSCLQDELDTGNLT